MITLTPEQARVLAESAESPPRVVDPQTQQVYFLVSGEVYARAQALVEEEQDVLGMYPFLASYDDSPWTDEEMAMLAAEDADLLGWEGTEAYQDRE
jgi:hypothetical protein